jgi:hypothetical protein
MYELMGWRGNYKSNMHTLWNWNCSLLMERMLLIKIFSRIRVDTKKNVASQPSCGEEGFNIAMTTHD